MPNHKDRDPGDPVPPGVAAKYPPPLTEHDEEVKRKLEQLGQQPSKADEPAGSDGQGTGPRDE